ncbi:MAG: GNAT family N-acetyltransferase [Acidobacteria bacterium]|nr:GNAT family N-acetyltransferase [Acidobacteriota bacterium]
MITEEALPELKELLVEYMESLGVEPCFQNFEHELANLPGDYIPPDGRLLIALIDGSTAGCIALRKLESGICEMKRLYVRPQFRGLQIGRALAEAVIAEARNIGYLRMRLDTLPSMKSAQKLYHSMGFKEISPYQSIEIEGTRFLELVL